MNRRVSNKRRGQPETGKLWDEDPKKIPFQKSKKRAVVLLTVVFFCFLVIVFRLVDLMIIDHEKLSSRAERQYNRTKTLKAQRGVIWDRRMREMATNLETDSLYIVPSKIKSTRELTRNLSPLLKVSSKDLNRMLLRNEKKKFVWLERRMTLRRARKVRELKKNSDYEELGFRSETKRYYPKGETASHLLGFTDIDDKGIAGLEMKYDSYLRGKKQSVSMSADARGNKLFSDVKDLISGNNLVLTIDEGIQYLVERELAEAMKKWDAKAAVAIMMDPSTGEILSMANKPDYDPNLAGKSRFHVKRNRAVTDLFEPGSTIKTALAAAALEEGAADIDEEFDVSRGYIITGGKRIRDIHRNEILTFQEVIQRSSNVGAVQIGQKLGAEKYYSYLRKFGFGEKSGIDYPGEVRGLLRRTDRWSGTSLGALSIGQELGATPLQILQVYATIANGGVLMKPYIVSDIISSEGEVIKTVKPEIKRRVVSTETAETITEILKTVVEEGGTARNAYIKGNCVAGKTGTAQVFDHKAGRYSKKKYISSFVGFVPADDPKLALIVVVYEPKGKSYGGLVAAPVFKNIVEHTFAYLDIPMEQNGNRIYLVSKVHR